MKNSTPVTAYGCDRGVKEFSFLRTSGAVAGKEVVMRVISILFLMLLGSVSFADNHTAVIWSGGFGVEERAQAPREGTKLVFALVSGHFVKQTVRL